MLFRNVLAALIFAFEIETNPLLGGGGGAVAAAVASEDAHRMLLDHEYYDDASSRNAQYPGLLRRMQQRPVGGSEDNVNDKFGNHHRHHHHFGETAAVKNWHEKAKQNNDGRDLLEDATPLYTIPVGVYNFRPANYDTAIVDDEGLIYREDVEDLIESLNWGFRDTAFHFELFGAMDVYNDTYANCNNQREFNEKFKPSGQDFLTVYFCDANTNNTLLGSTADDSSCGLTETISDITIRDLNETDYLADGVYLINPNQPNSPCTLQDIAQSLIHEVRIFESYAGFI